MLKLETFELNGDAGAAGRPSPDPRSEIEESRLAGYDQGYQAGWDDAAAAQADERNRISADLARHLQGLAFTWHEARMHILQSLEPLLLAMVTRVLPAISHETLAPLVLQHLLPMVEQQADTPALVRVNPTSRAKVETLLLQVPGLMVQLQDDPNLDEGQVQLRLGVVETHVDMTRAINQITAAVQAFFTLEQENQHD